MTRRIASSLLLALALLLAIAALVPPSASVEPEVRCPALFALPGGDWAARYRAQVCRPQ